MTEDISIRGTVSNHAPEGDERIRTAVGAPGADPVYEQLNALDRAAMCYREGLRHIIEECGNDKPRLDHIREAAERAISGADHYLRAAS